MILSVFAIDRAWAQLTLTQRPNEIIHPGMSPARLAELYKQVASRSGPRLRAP